MVLFFTERILCTVIFKHANTLLDILVFDSTNSQCHIPYTLCQAIDIVGCLCTRGSDEKLSIRSRIRTARSFVLKGSFPQAAGEGSADALYKKHILSPALPGRAVVILETECLAVTIITISFTTCVGYTWIIAGTHGVWPLDQVAGTSTRYFVVLRSWA